MKMIVVAVSDVATDQPAIDWGLRFATAQAATVELLHVVDTTWGHAPEDYLETALRKAEEKLREAARSARTRFPEVAIETKVRFGSPVTELVMGSTDAQLLVVGAHPKERNSGASRRTLRLVSQASCSVVVVPSAVIPPGEGVVVGVDGSSDSSHAMRFAAAEADRFHESLIIVHSWSRPEPWALTEPLLLVTDPSDEDEAVISESIAALGGDYPDLAIRSEIVASRPEHALYAAAVGARMLVVGSRGRHGLAKALLGSVSESVVSELPCAVAVIRAYDHPSAALGGNASLDADRIV